MRLFCRFEPFQACFYGFDGFAFDAGIVLEFIKHFRAQIILETLLVGAFNKILRFVVAQIGLEYTGSTDRQEVFIDNRVELNCTSFNQNLDIGTRLKSFKLCSILDRIGEVAEARFANACPRIGESSEGVAQSLYIFSRIRAVRSRACDGAGIVKQFVVKRAALWRERHAALFDLAETGGV